jgi:anti-sigma B factor antagonist
MNFSRTDQGEETTLRVQGALDAVSAPNLREAMADILAEGRRQLVLDLSALRVIDSAGVGAIVWLYKRLREAGGDLRLTGVKDQPLAIFKLLRLDRVFTLK